ncbi:nitrate reductase associated protein [Calothrix sp. 336/3]|uniref:nitrate reductase associated protein n=1 Tax=Calothrix sp. 336/3 TaxID=1337936 RepID=UPI0004E2B8FC|nr:nitrate reductase associated protein [Calothrix sp. 336/3]
MAEFFQFEADFIDSLRCIPMQVRCHLDTCGIKLKLSDWNQLTQTEREQLVELPCTTDREVLIYRQHIQDLILQRTGKAVGELAIDPKPPWMDAHNIPETVQTQAGEFGVTISSTQWQQLSPLQRFALIKLSRSGHENRNFPRAIAEFNLSSHD